MAFNFNFGGTTTTTKSLFGSTTATTTTTKPAFGGFNFGGGTSSTGGSLLGTTQTSASGTSTGFSLGGLGNTTTSSSTLGSLLASSTAQTTAPSFGFNTATTTSSTGFSFGQTSTTTATSSSGISSIWNSTANSATAKKPGLGGVDPAVSGSGAGGGGTNGKPGDNKAVKETQVPQEILSTVNEFKVFLKEQKNIREQITRMSSKPLFKVQEEVSALKELLAVVSNGLHNNVAAVATLKQEAGQELKNAEIAQRTRDIPRGLQYENTAPNEFFQSLVEDFQSRMNLYRQYIEQMESHLSSSSEKTQMTAEELADTLNKLHHTFLGLAAQLYVTHEAVKSLKEQYLTYRQLTLGDSTDIFDKQKKEQGKAKTAPSVGALTGPTPFTGMSNTAAAAMAAALNRAQQPMVGAQGGLGQVGSLTNTGSMMGLQQQQPSLGLFGAPSGGGLFGQSNQNLSTNPGGLFSNKSATGGTGSSLFGGSTSQQTGGLFGGSSSAGGLFGGSSTQTGSNSAFGGTGGFNFGGGTQSSLFNTQSTGSGLQLGTGVQAFQLQTPPLGSKRNKKDGV